MRTDLELRLATVHDWELVRTHFERSYRPDHPFQHREFWEWQVSSPPESGAILAVAGDEIVGFRAYQVGGGFTWGMMTYVDPAFRGSGLAWALMRYFDEVTHGYGPAAATNSNIRMVRMYRHLQWYRSADLIRVIALRPDLSRGYLQAVTMRAGLPAPQGHYWRQPGITGVLLDSGAGVAQTKVGGFRLIETSNAQQSLEQIWNLGFNWADYVTSWNDPALDQMDEEAGWRDDGEAAVPWLLDPVVQGSRAQITVFSSVPLPPDFVVRRDYSDHGRVGSL